MSFLSGFWHQVNGQFLTGANNATVKVFSRDGAITELSNETRGFVAQCYKSFCDTSAASTFSDRGYSRRYIAPDGTHVAIRSNRYNVVIYVAEKSQTGGSAWDMEAVLLFASDEQVWGAPPKKRDDPFEEGPILQIPWTPRVASRIKEYPIRPDLPVKAVHGTRSGRSGNLSNSVPGNRDWSDRRGIKDGDHYGMVLSWWVPGCGRYSYSSDMGPTPPSSPRWATTAINNNGAIATAAFRIPVHTDVIWFNGRFFAQIPEDNNILAACLHKKTPENALEEADTVLRVVALAIPHASSGPELVGYEIKTPSVRGYNPSIYALTHDNVVWRRSQMFGFSVAHAGYEFIHCNSSGTKAVFPCGYSIDNHSAIYEIDLATGEISNVDGPRVWHYYRYSHDQQADINFSRTYIRDGQQIVNDPVNAANFRETYELSTSVDEAYADTFSASTSTEYSTTSEYLLAVDYDKDSIVYVKLIHEEDYYSSLQGQGSSQSSLAASASREFIPIPNNTAQHVVETSNKVVTASRTASFSSFEIYENRIKIQRNSTILYQEAYPTRYDNRSYNFSRDYHYSETYDFDSRRTTNKVQMEVNTEEPGSAVASFYRSPNKTFLAVESVFGDLRVGGIRIAYLEQFDVGTSESYNLTTSSVNVLEYSRTNTGSRNVLRRVFEYVDWVETDIEVELAKNIPADPSVSGSVSEPGPEGHNLGRLFSFFEREVDTTYETFYPVPAIIDHVRGFFPPATGILPSALFDQVTLSFPTSIHETRNPRFSGYTVYHKTPSYDQPLCHTSSFDNALYFCSLLKHGVPLGTGIEHETPWARPVSAYSPVAKLYVFNTNTSADDAGSLIKTYDMGDVTPDWITGSLRTCAYAMFLGPIRAEYGNSPIKPKGTVRRKRS